MADRLEDDEHVEPSNMFAQTFARGLAVITAFKEESEILTISQVAQLTKVTRSTARRLLYTLTTLGYATTDGKHFTLTPKILDLGYAYLASSAIWRFAEPYVEQLVEDVGESASISVLEGHDVVYVLRIQQRRLLKSPLNVGSRVPAHAISMGRIQLAALSDRELNTYLASAHFQPFTRWTITNKDELKKRILEDRQQGWSMVWKELEEGIAGVAVPLRSTRGRTLAAINISLNPDRLSEPGKKEFLIEQLLKTAADIKERLPS